MGIVLETALKMAEQDKDSLRITIRRLCDAIGEVDAAYKSQGLHMVFRAIVAAEEVAAEARKEVGS